MKSLKNSLFIYLVIAFVAISCGSDPSPAKICKLTKITTGNITTTYSYNAQGKISEIKIK